MATTLKAVAFDLDGTLLDTLPDLVRLTNKTLEEKGYPPRTSDEILSFVGDGARMLLRRAVPPSVSETELDGIYARWSELYPTYGYGFTEPYPGILEMLALLKREGLALAVLSNKFDQATKYSVANMFPADLFDEVKGDDVDIERKPSPKGIRYVLEKLGIQPSELIYVGDSPTDIQAAHAANVRSVAVTWGYRPADLLLEAHPDKTADSAAELESLVLCAKAGRW